MVYHKSSKPAGNYIPDFFWNMDILKIKVIFEGMQDELPHKT